MSLVHQQSDSKTSARKTSILLMDTNSERRALRKKIMALRGVEVIGAGDLTEASSIWHRDRYDMVLLDIRLDHRGCMAFRDEIKKESPKQVVAFLVGKPNFVDIDPEPNSYVGEEYGEPWGDSLRKAVRESCDLLPQRYSFVEASWRIAAGKKINGAHQDSSAQDTTENDVKAPASSPLDFVPDLDGALDASS